MTDEYIRRKDAVKIAEKYGLTNGSVLGRHTGLADCIASEIATLSAADVTPVAHGRWVHTDKHLWYKNEDGSIDEWRLDVGFHNGPECEVCGECFCMHCHPDYTELKCKVGHYVCSKCGEASRDGHEKYCPCCGAKMDGGSDNGK